jgi:hypothetical protein
MEISRAAVLRRVAAASRPDSGSAPHQDPVPHSASASASVPRSASASVPYSDSPSGAHPVSGIPEPASEPHQDPAETAEPAEPTSHLRETVEPPHWLSEPSSAAEPAELTRPAWQLAVLQGQGLGDPARPDHSDRPDPMADTMYLSRLTAPEPVTQPVQPDSGLEADPVGDAGPTAGGGPIADEPLRSRATAAVLRQRRRLAVCAAGVVALAALLALPPVRAQLRDSFTRLPQPYTALYFTAPPQVDGTVLTVPVSVHAVETGPRDFSVRVWTVDAKGRVDDSRTADLTWDGQAMSTTVSMPVNPAAEYVWVSLDGSDQILHYKIAVA